MWSSEINEYLKDEKDFIGCFPYDKLSSIKKKKKFSLIINTGDSQTVGEHWIAVKVNGKKCFYFDSFGLPIMNVFIKEFLKKYEKCYYSRICIQDISSTACGMFCIMFIKYVNSFSNYVSYIRCFSKDNLSLNDYIVKSFE